jgi:Aldehyde dehydrogenase family
MAITETTTVYEAPGSPGSPVELRPRYENFIGGEWVAQTSGRYRENVTPSTGAFVKIGRDEGAEVLIGGDRPALDGDLAGGFYYEPTVLKGHNAMRVFQEEIFGPVQRHPVRARRGRVDARRQPRVPDGPRDQGRPRVDQLLPPVPGARRVRRLQGVRGGPREPPPDARALHAGQVHARQLRPNRSASSRPMTGGIPTSSSARPPRPSAASWSRIRRCPARWNGRFPDAAAPGDWDN